MPEQNPQQHSELASFGEELRREREIRGISLKEIADATKISRRFLEAIERNDHKTLPAPVFTRGFVREYARYLGLNSEEMVNRYNFAAAGDERIEKSDHLERLVHPEPTIEPKPLKKSGIPPAYSRIADRNVVMTVLIIAALALMVRAAGGSATWTYSSTIIQISVPDSYLGRVFSLDWAAFYLAITISTLVTGILIDTLGSDNIRAITIGTGLLSLIPLVLWAATVAWLEKNKIVPIPVGD